MTTTAPLARLWPRPAAGDPPAGRESVVWRVAVRAAGGLLVLTGAGGFVGWAAGVPEYLQLDPARPPLDGLTAAGLAAWGGGLLAVGGRRPRAARLLAAGLGAVAVALAVGGGTRAGAEFGLAAAGVWAVAGRRLDAAAAVAGAGLVAAGVWPADRTPVLGAVGGLAGGLALVAAAVRRGTPPVVVGNTLPMAAATSGVVLTLSLWAGLTAEQTRRINRLIQFEAAHLQRLTLDRLAQEVGAVADGAERWHRDGPDRLREEVGSYVGQRPGCLGVARVGGGGRVTWVESRHTIPSPGTLAALGVDGPVGEAARAGRVAVVRPPRSLWKGVRVLVIFAPAQPGGRDAGGLLCVLRLHDLLDTVANTNGAAGYAVEVDDGGDRLYARFAADEAHRAGWGQALALPFHGADWRLTVWPTPEVFDRDDLSLPRLALVIGLLTTGLLALAVHLAQTARRRTAALEVEVRERELAQRALVRSEQRSRALIENLDQPVFLQDAEHRYVAANAPFCRAAGRTEAEVVGRTEADLFDPPRALVYAEEARTVLAEGKSVETEEERAAGDARTWVRRVLTPVRDPAGQVAGVLGIWWDVTEQRRLEGHVHQASKMDAIGQLAGGIAHDFNNLLTAILGNLELLLLDLPAGGRAGELAEAARGATTRAASLTQRLLGFSRRHQLDWVPTDLNAVVGEVVALLRRTIDPLITLEVDGDPRLWPVLADPAQLNQVLMNLCLNARDALPGHGRIAVETACVPAGELPPGVRPAGRGGEFVRLRVTDTGSGMTDEVKARIYEPFFTTKEVGKGTGLGLPMVFAIVRQHKGWIDCRSEVGRGTRFDVYLPRGGVLAAAAPKRSAAAPAPAGRETVLVVDDEEMIRRVAVATLNARGYTVLEAADGQEAVDLYSREAERIDLVLLDLTMPVLSGHEAFRHLLNLNPRVRVLFASGYALEDLSDLEKELMAGFVKKPYRPAELTAAVADALRAGDPGDAETVPDGAELIGVG